MTTIAVTPGQSEGPTETTASPSARQLLGTDSLGSPSSSSTWSGVPGGNRSSATRVLTNVKGQPTPRRSSVAGSSLPLPVGPSTLAFAQTFFVTIPVVLP